MRILQIAPLWERVPPPAYGGTEAVVSLLTEELVRQGHRVTLAASGDSITTARLASVFPQSLRTADGLVDRSPYDWVHVGQALAQADEFDIVHNHAGELVMAMSAMLKTPILTTMHCLTTPDTQFVWNRYTGAYNTISRASRDLHASWVMSTTAPTSSPSSSILSRTTTCSSSAGSRPKKGRSWQ
jgi:hypothetical protein